MAPRMIMLTDDSIRDLVLIISDAIANTEDPQWSREDARAIRDFMEERAAEAEPTKPEPLLEWEAIGKLPGHGWKAPGIEGEYLIKPDDSGAAMVLYELTFTPSAAPDALSIKRENFGPQRDLETAWKKAEKHHIRRKTLDGLEKLKDGNLFGMLRSTTVDGKLTWLVHEERGGWYAEGFAGRYYAKPVGSEYSLTFMPPGFRGQELCIGGLVSYADMAALVTAAEEHNAIEIPPPVCATGRFDPRAPNRFQGPAEPPSAPESDAEPPTGTETPPEEPEFRQAAVDWTALELWNLLQETCTAAGMRVATTSSKLPEVVGKLLKAQEALRLIVQSSRLRRLLGAIKPDVLHMACEALGLPDSFVGSSEEKKE